MASTLVEFDPVTRKIQLGQAKHVKRFEEAELKILAALGESPRTEGDLILETKGKTETTRAALRRMVERGTVARDGAGRRGSPYVYSLAPVFDDFGPDQLHLDLGFSAAIAAA
jgi:hypothetical protein